MSKKKNEETNEEIKNEEIKEEPAVDETKEEPTVGETKDEAESAEETEEKALTREEELEAKVLELNDRLLRNLAEFDNYRKRTNAEKAAMYSAGAADAADRLLPVFDNFERALNSEQDKESSFYKGVEMIFKQMNDAFCAMGITEIKAEGETFDPNLHNAVMHIENEDLGENVVSMVLQKGYKYKDKVLRPAMVQVAN